VTVIEINEVIKDKWENPYVPIDWLKMELLMRETLKLDDESAFMRLSLIDEILASFTGRGNEM